MPKKPKNLRTIMEFFGTDFSQCPSDSEEIIGNECPICGKDNNHFFLNFVTNLWKCHSCGREGGYHDFLDYIWTEKIEFEPSAIELLSKERELNIEAFMPFYNLELGYYNDMHWFPVYNQRNRITDIRYWIPEKKAKSLPGVEAGIYNGKELFFKQRQSEPVYICEGEFDTIALNWVLRKNKLDGFCVGLPGSNNFKKEWAPLFRNREIILCFDHDTPGEEGCKRIKKLLKDYQVDISKIFWPENFPTRFDINNFITLYGTKTRNPEICWKTLKKLIRPYDVKSADILAKMDNVPEHITFPELLVKYKEVLSINENYLQTIKIGLATVLSLKICGNNPIWLFLVGPPGFGKTEILSSMKYADACEFKSSISRGMLISGFKAIDGTDPSILSRMDGRCLVLKDYTEVLGMSHTDRKETIGTLRGIYDGSAEKLFGNQVLRKYELKMGILAGVTDAIKQHAEAAMGERFLRFSLETEDIDYEEQQMQALMSSFFGNDKKETLQLWVKRFLEQDWDISEERIKHYFSSSKDFISKIIHLAKLTAALRVEVSRHENGANWKEIAYKPRFESGNRLTVQFQRLAIALAIIEGKDTLDDEIYKIIKKVAFDTVDKYETTICRTLHSRNGNKLCRGDLTERTGLTPSAVSIYIENLYASGLIEKHKVLVNGQETVGYALHKEINQLWKKV